MISVRVDAYGQGYKLDAARPEVVGQWLKDLTEYLLPKDTKGHSQQFTITITAWT